MRMRSYIIETIWNVKSSYMSVCVWEFQNRMVWMNVFCVFVREYGYKPFGFITFVNAVASDYVSYLEKDVVNWCQNYQREIGKCVRKYVENDIYIYIYEIEQNQTKRIVSIKCLEFTMLGIHNIDIALISDAKFRKYAFEWGNILKHFHFVLAKRVTFDQK